MPNPQAGRPPASAAPPGPQSIRLRKGDLLFAEGENSRAMYYLKTGMIRIFKKKGEAHIEINTVHSGEIIGELAFLDGNPRSASGEALTDCELMEISGPTFQAVLINMPDWLKILLKTIVGRLRTASTRIRQLETASTSFDYSEKDGKRQQHYTYLSPNDVLKIATALLLVASRNGEPVEEGINIRVGLLQRYGNQIMGIPVAKVTTFLDVLAQVGVTNVSDDGKVSLKEIDFLEHMIAYLNEENLLEPAKRHDISAKSFIIMSLIAKHLFNFPPNESTGVCTVNLAQIKKMETLQGKEPFRFDEIQDLVKLGYCGTPTIKSATEAYTSVKLEPFMNAFKLQRIVMAVSAVNIQKRKATK